MWWKYLPLAITPGIIGFFAALIWVLIGPYLQVQKADVEMFQWVFATPAVAHALVASMLIKQGYTQKHKIEEILSSSKPKISKFKKNACVQIDPVAKSLLFWFSIVFFILSLFYPFQSYKAGIVAVSVTVFTLYLLWKVAQELFNLYEGVHRVSKQRVIEVFGEEVYQETLKYFEDLKVKK